MTDIDIQQLKEVQDELKWCISRLSFVGMGLSEKLDRSLKKLRDEIKNDADSEIIKQSVEQISRLLLTIEETESESEPAPKVEVAGIEDDFTILLRDERLPLPLKNRLNQAQHKVTNDGAVKIARSMVEIIFDYLQQHARDNFHTRPADEESSKNHEEESGGFFTRMLGRRAKNKSKTEEAPDIATQPSYVLDELRESLQELINQLSSIENYSKIAVKLTKKVNQLNSINELVEILEMITGAFVEVTNQEHQQLENFLKSLSQRIDRVNGFVNNTMAFSRQVSNDTQALDNTLQGSVTEIKASVEKSKMLQVVKDDLNSKMDSIVSTVNLFREQQEKNQQKLNHDIEMLHDQLRATQDESIRLRDEIVAQRIRAQTDQLTNLPNRYSYNERLTQEYNRWRRYRSPLTLVICDIDHFKRINDLFGHAGGDEVLKIISQYLQDQLRESDFVARFGGEEFVMLLPETSLIDATKAMNKLRLGIKELTIDYEDKTITTAMSFGISEFENNDTPKAVFARADRALYRAKEKGRDQVCCQRA